VAENVGRTGRKPDDMGKGWARLAARLPAGVAARPSARRGGRVRLRSVLPLVVVLIGFAFAGGPVALWMLAA
jgi:hypothetical protein